MNLLDRLADRLIERAKRTPYFPIYKRNGLYMDRFWLLPPGRYRWQRWIRVSVRVHHICQPDTDYDLHDHPWRFVSLVLRGWYREKLPAHQDQHPARDPLAHRYKIRRAGSWATRAATDRHSIQAVSPGGSWTLFIMFGKERRWGFHTEHGWIYWREYLNDYETVTASDNPGVAA